MLLWLRDIPFLDPSFGDTGQLLVPFVYAGVLATATERITIGTTGTVLPLRNPLIVVKQAQPRIIFWEAAFCSVFLPVIDPGNIRHSASGSSSGPSDFAML